jgi:hypothetical protein
MRKQSFTFKKKKKKQFFQVINVDMEKEFPVRESEFLLL